jgi:hypothetical protein
MTPPKTWRRIDTQTDPFFYGWPYATCPSAQGPPSSALVAKDATLLDYPLIFTVSPPYTRVGRATEFFLREWIDESASGIGRRL